MALPAGDGACGQGSNTIYTNVNTFNLPLTGTPAKDAGQCSKDSLTSSSVVNSFIPCVLQSLLTPSTALGS